MSTECVWTGCLVLITLAWTHTLSEKVQSNCVLKTGSQSAVAIWLVGIKCERRQNIGPWLTWKMKDTWERASQQFARRWVSINLGNGNRKQELHRMEMYHSLWSKKSFYGLLRSYFSEERQTSCHCLHYPVHWCVHTCSQSHMTCCWKSGPNQTLYFSSERAAHIMCPDYVW